MKKHKQIPSFEELSELIVEAIINEPFFNKEKLVPKIKSIMSAFNLKMIDVKLDSVVTETDKTRFLKALKKEEFERKFWRDKIKEHLPEKLNEFYKELDEITLKNK